MILGILHLIIDIVEHFDGLWDPLQGQTNLGCSPHAVRHGLGQQGGHKSADLEARAEYSDPLSDDGEAVPRRQSMTTRSRPGVEAYSR